MLTKRAPDAVGTATVLKTYGEIHRGKPVVVDEEQSLVKSHLKLSGVVRRQGRSLRVRNLIYQRVFDWRWIRSHLPESLWQRLKPAMPIIAILLAGFIAMMWVAIYANQQRQIAVAALRQRRVAEQQSIVAIKQRQEAIAQRHEAIAQRQLLEALLQRSSVATPTLSPRLKAFLEMVAWSLGTAQPEGYTLFISGESFTDFKDHPRQPKCAFYGGREICSDNAGRYFIHSSTWDALVQQIELPDFSPQSQDKAAVELIRQKNALEDIETGRLEPAIYKLSSIWGSLPNSNGVSSYEFQNQSIDTLISVYDIFYLKYLYPEITSSD
jgi:muramidase (phage lysozyme)